MSETGHVLCLGAGPACLTAAYRLAKAGVPVTVIERDPALVGGISRTVDYKGFLFDIGGHRFFSKSETINRLWAEVLPDDFIERPRKSRIYYRGKLFDYPLKAMNALTQLGPFEALRCMASYGLARLRPIAYPANFEEWVSNKFGRRLFSIFFRTYTEKVWGMKCTEISADWAAQRIKGLSLGKAVMNALFSRHPRAGEAAIKTLIDRFSYPRRGPGMMWHAMAERVVSHGGRVEMGQNATGARFDRQSGLWRVTAIDASGRETHYEGSHLVSSVALRDLVPHLAPAVPPQVAAAAARLRYRDFIVVALILKDRALFDDNWLYIHDPAVKVGRIQNFKSWSPEMVPDPALTCYGLEYFCFAHDDLWECSDEALLALATAELASLGLADADDVVDGCVVRQEKAYPVYDEGYQADVEIIRQGLGEQFATLHLVGRNGMHKYNNQDHAMMTGLLTAENIIAGEARYDVWRVNQDAEYHERGEPVDETGLSGRLVPGRAS